MARVGAAALVSRRGSDQRWAASARLFGDALRAADAQRATATATAAYREGLTIAGVYDRVIAPAMYQIGERWQDGAITAAEEHLATAIAHRVIASLYAALEAPPASKPATVILAAPEGEHHGLGLRMASDVLEAAGFPVIYLGTDVPLDALAAAVERYRPAAVGLSLTMPLGATNLEAAITAVLEARPGTRLLLGGQGVSRGMLDAGIPHVANLESLVRELERSLTAPALRGPQRTGSAATRAAPRRVTSSVPQGVGTPEDRLLSETIAMAQLVREQARLGAQFRALTFKDHLSGLPNRRAFDDRFFELVETGAAAKLAVALIDVDDFRRINDQLGHREGDKALQLVTDVLRRHLRGGDFPARVGGDQFAALLPGIEPDAARALAERLQQRIMDVSGPLAVTVSAGIAWFGGDRRRTLLDAEEAVFAAKAQGGNAVRLGRATVTAPPA